MSGIVALATVLIVPGSALLAGSVSPAGHNIWRALEQVGLMTIVMYYAFVGCLAFMLWGTKQVFNASGYRSADALVAWLLGVLVFLPPLAFPLGAWFSIHVIKFGKRVGSPLWQAIGLIYLVAVVLLAAAIAVFSTNIHMSTATPFEFVAIPVLTLFAGCMCHGVCLILSARRLAE